MSETFAGEDQSCKARAADEERAPDVVIITGLSGSGMSSAMNAFEDRSYFCVDNLPLTLLATFARLIQPTGDAGEEAVSEESGRGNPKNAKPHIERAALVIDIREGRFLSEFREGLDALRAAKLSVFVLFLEASDEVLERRFSETRRPHPADAGGGLGEAIRLEREAMQEIRSLADRIVDTSSHTVHTLRRLLVEEFARDEHASRLRVQVVSFGHKHGGLRDVHLLFDVRHLPNPYFVPELRDFSGNDVRIVRYLKAQPEATETLRRFTDLLLYLLPLYEGEGKAYLTIGIGCTGGRHRSVMIANEIARQLRRAGFDAKATHRDIAKAKKRARVATRTETKLATAAGELASDVTGEAAQA